MSKKSNYIFVERPIFATVISIIITMMGIVAMRQLPIEQFPDLTPPQVNVSASYTGASADIMADSVASVLESEINGVDDMIYMSSVSSNAGTTSIDVTFETGTDPEIALINVNNRVQQALASLPQEVQTLGVSVTKKSSSIVMLLGINSPNNMYDTIYLNNYANINIVDTLKLVPGIGDITIFADEDYSMRIWFDTMKLANYNLSPQEVITAIQSQNALYAAGSVAGAPTIKGVEVAYQFATEGRFSNVKQFEDIVIRAESDGSLLHLKDVARVELGAESYSVASEMNGNQIVAIGIYLSPGANALGTVTKIKETMEQLSKNFPVGVGYSVMYDTTEFVKISIEEVVKTLFEAMLLVFLVVYLFLQNWRATLIPCIAVPVSIIGTFAGIYAFGFSINTLTLFGLVLAIGMVVDDAIVVLENVERHMSTGKSAKEATTIAMSEVSRPVIAIVFVLSSVFLPIAFLGGLAGQMYKQFSITIIISVVISGIVALTFTPALTSILLKPKHSEPILPFRMFNSFFEKTTERYTSAVRFLMNNGVATLVLFIVICGSAGVVLKQIPTSMLPNEDQGYIVGFVALPDGAVLERTEAVSKQLQAELSTDKTVENITNIMGFNMVGGAVASNYATMFVTMTDWDVRKQADESSYALADKYMGIGATLPEGYAIAFNPPPISGLGLTGGFEVYLQNRIGDSLENMAVVTQKLATALRERKELTGINASFALDMPQIKVTVDRDVVSSMGISIGDVFSVMQATFGTKYVNDFSMLGRTFKVFAQADAEFRARPNDLSKVYVKNSNGEMTPLSAIVKTEMQAGAQTISRFNNFPAVKFLGSPVGDVSSGDAMAIVEEVAAEVLPEGYTLGWSGISYQEKETSGNTSIVFILALIMVFLILAAQYESWSLPITVITAVPFALLGAAIATWGRGLMNDIYFQVALVTLVGLAAKNAILIVEFAAEKYRKEGMSIFDAALTAAKLRFRPIIMTSLAFIFGCVPLAISSGAGANSRHAVGTAVVGGMLFATILAPLFVPYFFKAIVGISSKLFGNKDDE